MNEKEIKRKLEDDGYRVIDVARHMAKVFDLAERSAETMLRDLIAGRRWFPVYADWLHKEYGIRVVKPQPFRSVRERMRVAA